MEENINKQKEQNGLINPDAGEIARQRLNNYLDEKLKGQWDTTKWEFYNFLLNQAKQHKLSFSGYLSPEFKKDQAESIAICKKHNEEYMDKTGYRHPEERSGRRR